MNFNNIKRKLYFSIIPSLFIVSNIFFFGPFTIYRGNITEFSTPFISILNNFLFPSIILLICLNLLSLFLPQKLQSCYISLLFILGILIWLQGNILVWDYGVVGITDIDWSKYASKAWLEAVIWITLLFLSLIFSNKLKKIAVFVCSTLILMQLFYVVIISIQFPSVWSKIKEDQSISPSKDIFTFSQEKNIIHIVLDELQTDITYDILNQSSKYYHKVLDGFTFFTDALSPFPTTIVNIPAIMSGRVYKNDIPVFEFVHKIMNGNSIPNLLYEHGYEVDLIHTLPPDYYKTGNYNNFYTIPHYYSRSDDSIRHYSNSYTEGKKIQSIVIFRHVPHFFKKKFATSNLVKESFGSFVDITESERIRRLSHKLFLQDLIDNILIDRGAPVYKFIHLATTHYPASTLENCEEAGKALPWNWENIRIQAKCSFDHFLQFIDRLKELNIYDSSLIIIQADHGYYHVYNSKQQVEIKNLGKDIRNDNYRSEEYIAQMFCAARPTLLIKPPYHKGELKVSDSPVSTIEIPATIVSLLGFDDASFPGKSIFKVQKDEKRKRTFLYYDSFNDHFYFDKLNEYLIQGPILDTSSWQMITSHERPGVTFKAKAIDFGTEEAIPYLISGWSKNEKNPEDGLTYNWALGSSAALKLALPKSKAIRLKATIISPEFKTPQIVDIKIDGKYIGSWKLPNKWQWRTYRVDIDPDSNRPNNSIIEFCFSQQREPQEGGDPRPLAVLFESLVIEDL